MDDTATALRQKYLKPTRQLGEKTQHIYDRVVNVVVDKGSEVMQNVNKENFTHFAVNGNLLKIHWIALMECESVYAVDRRFRGAVRQDLLISLLSMKEYREKFRPVVQEMITDFVKAAEKHLQLNKSDCAEILEIPLRIDQEQFLNANRETGFFRGNE